MAPVYATRHLLVRAFGSFGSANGQEKWSAGFRFGQLILDTSWDEAKAETFADACAAAMSNFHATAGVMTGDTTYFNGCTVAPIGTDGKYFPSTANTVFSDPYSTAGNGSLLQEWTACLTISLRTTRPRGYASNGRVYWPATAATIDPTTGKVALGALNTRMSAAKTMCNALNTAAATYQTGMYLIVASPVAPGLNAQVTEIRTDNRVDNQERRENAVPPIYSTQALG